MQVAIFQNDSVLADPERQLRALDDAAAQITGQADLLVTPELFLTGYNAGSDQLRDLASPSDGPHIEAVRQIAREHRVALVVGYPERDGKDCFNAAICIDANGSILANHRKFSLPSPYEKSVFSTGNKVTVFEISGICVAVLICYDVEFPEYVRACTRAGADLVVVPTALREHWAHLTRALIPTRAIENGVYLAYANYSGQERDFNYCGLSCIIGPDGFDCARANGGMEIIIAQCKPADIAAARVRLPYLQDLRSDIAV